MSIIDSHFHIWHMRDLPWLAGPVVPRIFGSYEPLKRDYLIEEYLEDIRASGIDKAVYVQANWAPARAVAEVDWLHEVADRTGWPHAVVAYVNLLHEEMPATLKRLAGFPLVRGGRMQLFHHDNPAYRAVADPNVLNDTRLHANLRHLTAYGWSFDLQVFAPQMRNAARLVRDNPDITFALVHAGMLEDLTPAGRRAWREGMQRLSQAPNVVVKLSGLGTFLRRNDPDFIAEVTADTIAMFGANRCMFGSNFPIEKLWTRFSELMAVYQAALKSCSATHRDDILRATASRVYRL